jgi:hypothetical protein
MNRSIATATMALSLTLAACGGGEDEPAQAQATPAAATSAAELRAQLEGAADADTYVVQEVAREGDLVRVVVDDAPGQDPFPAMGWARTVASLMAGQAVKLEVTSNGVTVTCPAALTAEDRLLSDDDVEAACQQEAAG